jgi:hypothetical protein
MRLICLISACRFASEAAINSLRYGAKCATRQNIEHLIILILCPSTTFRAHDGARAGSLSLIYDYHASFDAE